MTPPWETLWQNEVLKWLSKEEKEIIHILWTFNRDKFSAEVWGESETPAPFAHAQSFINPKDSWIGRQVSELWRFIKVLKGLYTGGEKINTEVLKKVIWENANIVNLVWEIIIQNMLSTMIVKRLEMSDEDKKNIQKEIDTFLTKKDVQPLIQSLLTWPTLKDVITQIETIAIFSGKLSPEQTSIKRDVTLNQHLGAITKLYNHASVQPLVQKFFDDYKWSSGTQSKFPTLKKYTEGKTDEKVSPEYQKFITDPTLQKAKFDILANPKLPVFLTNCGKRLDGITQIINGRWWDRNKKLWIEQELVDLSNDFLEIFWPYIQHLKGFLEKNPEIWKYFKDNGLVIWKKTEWTSWGFGIDSANIFRLIFGKGIAFWTDIDYLQSGQFFEWFFQPEVLSWMMLAYFLEIYDIWGELSNNNRTKQLLAQHGISFHRTAYWAWLNKTKATKPEHKERIMKLRSFLLSLNNGNISWNSFRRGVETFKPKQ